MRDETVVRIEKRDLDPDGEVIEFYESDLLPPYLKAQRLATLRASLIGFISGFVGGIVLALILLAGGAL